MIDSSEQSFGEINLLLEKVKGTPAYFGFRLNNYWERIIAFIDTNGLRDRDFEKQLADLDYLNSKLPLPKTEQECEEREVQMKQVSQVFAKVKNMTFEQFWADFDPEAGLDKLEMLKFLDQKNTATGFIRF